MKVLAIVFSALVLAACGGGGGGGGATATLSATQTNFETATVKDSYVSFDWNLPTTNVAPTPGTHYFYAMNYSAAASPSTGVQLERTTSNMTATLGLPNFSKLFVYRVLKSGVIYVTNLPSKGTLSYLGNDVVSTTYATDGLTTLYSAVYDEWSGPIALTGPIGSTSVLKSFYWFAKQTAQTTNYDFTKNWLAGSTYSTRKGYRQADCVFVYDTSGKTYDANVTPVPTSVTTIEDLFNSASYVAAGGVTVDGVVYPFSGGAIRSIEGVRAWVATNKRPTSASPTDEYVVLFELNGKIYFGGLQKAA